jgi:hypothetical protein
MPPDPAAAADRRRAAAWGTRPRSRTRRSYQWLRNGKKISKATGRIYRIKRKDRGKKLACRISLAPAAGGARIVVKTKAVKIPRRR